MVQAGQPPIARFAKERGRNKLPISPRTLTRRASEDSSLARRVSGNNREVIPALFLNWTVHLHIFLPTLSKLPKSAHNDV